MISYNIIGDTLTKVFQRIPDGQLIYIGCHVIILSVAILTLPSLYQNISKLGKVSFISLILTVVILIIGIIRAITFSTHISQAEIPWEFPKPNAIQAIGVMSLASICHHNNFLIFGFLEECTLSHWVCVTQSVSFATFVSLVFAIYGYVTFKEFTEGDFENYCRDNDLATFGRFCYGVTIILTLPTECFVTREVIANVFFKGNLTTISHVVAIATSISLLYDCLGIELEQNVNNLFIVFFSLIVSDKLGGG
ncbi:LOW QUALITY PROTEIN: putative sodium-coupled neutral amino acid transporter 11 [Liasis olivaceus]